MPEGQVLVRDCSGGEAHVMAAGCVLALCVGCWLFMLGFMLPLLQQAELLRTGDQHLLEQTALIPVVPATLLVISKKCVNRCFA